MKNTISLIGNLLSVLKWFIKGLCGWYKIVFKGAQFEIDTFNIETTSDVIILNKTDYEEMLLISILFFPFNIIYGIIWWFFGWVDVLFEGAKINSETFHNKDGDLLILLVQFILSVPVFIVMGITKLVKWIRVKKKHKKA